MCGRFGFDIPRQVLAEHFGLDAAYEIAPRYNIAPTQEAPAVLPHPDSGARVLRSLRWGLVPSWAKDAKGGARLVNARAETAAEKPAFRAAFKRRRCLAPAAGFYEWKRQETGKQPYWIRLLGGGPLAFAGLWDHWLDPQSGATLYTFAILTCPANPLAATLHDRMPVILPPAAYAAWLDPAATRPDLEALLAPFPAGLMEAWPVSKRVNNPRNDDPSLLDKVEP
ncbi:MAG: SOS response-associated peptidase [Thermodesulfobacteriota bacterium]